jgi:hypothetical protein
MSDFKRELVGDQLMGFVVESNSIEGIHREPTDAELKASQDFLALGKVTVADLQEFVSACQPGAVLRNRKGLDVSVGNHFPPPGGPQIETALKNILETANSGTHHPFGVHMSYETLHPFIDCNGRSGRILWAWQMKRQRVWPGLQLCFLHAWYYQSLEFSRVK